MNWQTQKDKAYIICHLPMGSYAHPSYFEDEKESVFDQRKYLLQGFNQVDHKIRYLQQNNTSFFVFRINGLRGDKTDRRGGRHISLIIESSNRYFNWSDSVLQNKLEYLLNYFATLLKNRYRVLEDYNGQLAIAISDFKSNKADLDSLVDDCLIKFILEFESLSKKDGEDGQYLSPNLSLQFLTDEEIIRGDGAKGPIKPDDEFEIGKNLLRKVENKISDRDLKLKFGSIKEKYLSGSLAFAYLEDSINELVNKQNLISKNTGSIRWLQGCENRLLAVQKNLDAYSAQRHFNKSEKNKIQDLKTKSSNDFVLINEYKNDINPNYKIELKRNIETRIADLENEVYQLGGKKAKVQARNRSVIFGFIFVLLAGLGFWQKDVIGEKLSGLKNSYAEKGEGTGKGNDEETYDTELNEELKRLQDLLLDIEPGKLEKPETGKPGAGKIVAGKGDTRKSTVGSIKEVPSIKEGLLQDFFKQVKVLNQDINNLNNDGELANEEKLNKYGAMENRIEDLKENYKLISDLTQSTIILLSEKILKGKSDLKLKISENRKVPETDELSGSKDGLDFFELSHISSPKRICFIDYNEGGIEYKKLTSQGFEQLSLFFNSNENYKSIPIDYNKFVHHVYKALNECSSITINEECFFSDYYSGRHTDFNKKLSEDKTKISAHSYNVKFQEYFNGPDNGFKIKLSCFSND